MIYESCYTVTGTHICASVLYNPTEVNYQQLTLPMPKYSFSGHETFHCRQFWLKKGYDFAKQQGQFNDGNAVAALGVGRNMVTSIQFWLKSFGLLNVVYD